MKSFVSKLSIVSVNKHHLCLPNMGSYGVFFLCVCVMDLLNRGPMSYGVNSAGFRPGVKVPPLKFSPAPQRIQVPPIITRLSVPPTDGHTHPAPEGSV